MGVFVPAGRRYRWEPFHFEECRAAKWNARKNKSGKRPVVYAMGRGMMDYKAKQTGAFCKGAAGGLRSGAEPVYPRREGGACPPPSPPPPPLPQQYVTSAYVQSVLDRKGS